MNKFMKSYCLHIQIKGHQYSGSVSGVCVSIIALYNKVHFKPAINNCTESDVREYQLLRGISFGEMPY